MSALTINKVACRVYGALFLLLGAQGLLLGGLLIYISVFGLPDRLSDWTLARAIASVDLKWGGILWGGGVAVLVLAAIPIAIGVFSYLRYVWAMIIGTVLWLVFYFPGPLLFFPGKVSGFAAFEIISTSVFVLLTIVAVMCRPRPTLLRASTTSITMTTMIVAAPSKLPLWRTIGQAYAVWARNFPDLVRTCWLWMLLMAPVVAIWMWWQEPHLAEMMQAASAGQPFADPNPVLTLVTQIVGQVIMLPALASVAVAWHRLLLKDEHPGPGVYLRLDSIVAGYAILAFWIGVITLAPSYVSMMFQNITGTSATMRGVAALVVQSLAGLASIIGFFIVARLSLALPGIALGRDDVTLGTAWRVSERNTWRMLWAYFFCILPPIAIGGGISYWLFRPDHSRAAVTLVGVVMSLLWIPGGMISVGMLSLAYRHFFERSA